MYLREADILSRLETERAALEANTSIILLLSSASMLKAFNVVTTSSEVNATSFMPALAKIIMSLESVSISLASYPACAISRKPLAISFPVHANVWLISIAASVNALMSFSVAFVTAFTFISCS